MLAPAEAQRLTGYHVGGISAFGQRKRVKTFVEAAALNNPTVIVNGGRRGLQIEIAPAELMRVLDAKPAEL
jgi:Cys-tRNA(Pro)/Cys-tRNA(Cys) deacylase